MNIVIGMTGRIDSAVAAYLLKKQGNKCVGVAINFTPELAGEEDNRPLFGECQKIDIEKAKAVCQALEIPFYLINAAEDFKSQVLDYLVSQRLAGKGFAPCVRCNRLKIELLIKQAKILGADAVATGHYAKVQENHKTKEFFLLSANDLASDQSYNLATLAQEDLSYLLLPLADIREQEVEKVAASLQIATRGEQGKEEKVCFQNSSAVVEFIEKNAAPSLRESGAIYDAKDDTYVTDHDGIYNFVLGQRGVRSAGGVDLDSSYEVVRIDPPRKSIYVSNSKDDNYSFRNCSLRNLSINSKMDLTHPIEVNVSFNGDSERPKAILYYKNAGNVVLEFMAPVKRRIPMDEFVILYNKEGPGARILASGMVHDVGDYEGIDRLADEEEDDGFRDLIEKEESEHKDKNKRDVFRF